MIADAVSLPGISYLGELMSEIYIDGLWAVRQHIRKVLASELADRWIAVYAANRGSGTFRFTPEGVGRRRLCGTALHYLSTDQSPEAWRRAAQYFESATNMTESIAGLSAIAELGGVEGGAALSSFYQRWKDQPLVLDKWFAIQARVPSIETLDRVSALLEHPAYDRKNPNRVGALVGGFAMGNPVRFHDAGGRGYRFLAEQVVSTDKLNPQLAARLVGPLGSWRRYDKGRQSMMRAQLELIVKEAGVSRDVFEIASKSLA